MRRARERCVERAERAFAAGVIFERGEGGEPGFDGGVGEFLDELEKVLLETFGELKDVVIGVQERGDEAAGFEGKSGESVEWIVRFPEHEVS